MNKAFLLYFLLPTLSCSSIERNDTCEVKFLTKKTPPARLTFNASQATYEIYHKVMNNRAFNFANISREILTQRNGVIGVIITRNKNYGLGLNITGRLRVFPNRTSETEVFWKSFNQSQNGWTPIFMDCYFYRYQWIHGYVLKTSDISIGLFIKVHISPCDESFEEVTAKHKCDLETTTCEPVFSNDRYDYRCICRPGFFRAEFTNQTSGKIGMEPPSDESMRCIRQPEEICYNEDGSCYVNVGIFLKTLVLCINLICIVLTITLGFFVFKHRKAKAISSGMWTILEIILLGACILYSSIFAKFFEMSVTQCFLEPWIREMGFVICYGAIILKLYHHLIEFRTRKAHRWVVKDTDLLKYLLIMTLSVFAYMAAFTAFMLDLKQENYDLLHEETISSTGAKYLACKPLLWDFVTQAGEVVILIFGIHLSYATRDAKTQFHERRFLCAAISIELTVSCIFYISKIFFLPGSNPDDIMIINCLRIQLSMTMTLILVFLPKFWYHHKQIRSFGQEYSCGIPTEAFKDTNAHGPLTGNNSDIEVGEITLADMSQDDIRAELKRLYLQLEIFKSKTICIDNPHISKRRGGRKSGHRRVSLQNFQGKKSKNHQRRDSSTEPEIIRTPEDSVCSTEGPSAINLELTSTST